MPANRLMSKWLMAIVAIILLVIVYYVVGSHLLRNDAHPSEEQAVGFALDELRYSYPDSMIDVFSVTNMTLESGESTWKIMAKVVSGNNTACPNLIEVEFHYPKFGFVTRERIITENCLVLGCRNVPYCIIAYPEEAVLMPLDAERNPSIQPAIANYFESAGGRANVTAQASYFESYLSGKNNTYSEVWVVAYSSPSLGYSLETVLNKTGGVVLEQYSKSAS